MKFDYSLYLVTDSKLAAERPLESIVAGAVKGGVSCVQLREKMLDTREFVAMAKRLKQLLGPLQIPLIINDRIDVALACEADGVHLGQSDMSIGDARQLVGRDMVIGISAESVADAVAAEKGGADYIGISPVFSTMTKKDIAQPLGLEGVKEIRSLVGIPLVGIGGINHENCRAVIKYGADGVAVVSAIVAAENPELAAQQMMEQLQAAKAYDESNGE